MNSTNMEPGDPKLGELTTRPPRCFWNTYITSSSGEYRIRPNNHTVGLGFLKLLWKLVLNYVSTYYK